MQAQFIWHISEKQWQKRSRTFSTACGQPSQMQLVDYCKKQKAGLEALVWACSIRALLCTQSTPTGLQLCTQRTRSGAAASCALRKLVYHFFFFTEKLPGSLKMGLKPLLYWASLQNRVSRRRKTLHTSLLSITNSLTQRMNMFSP